ncbi:ATP-grasp domain-containing protein [bacterium]|nr:ATP-grasp domain-containing protein [bacterium]
MPTLILPPRFTDDTNLVRKAAIHAGWKVERLPSWRVPEDLVGPDLVLYGEPLFAAVVADSLNLSLIEPSFDWLTTIPSRFIRRSIRFATLAQARTVDCRSFIKPADDKCFRAQVYDSGRDLPTFETLPAETPVLISNPVDWTVEFRCFVLNRRLQTLSPYSRNGDLAQGANGDWPASDTEIHQATEFIEQVLADNSVMLPPAVVVDVGIIGDMGWAVVEANPAWGSGIYGCDPLQVLPVLERCSIDSDSLSDGDRRWIPQRRIGT